VHRWGQDADLEAFQRAMIEAHQRHPVRIVSYCVLSHHWHFVGWHEDDDKRVGRKAEELGLGHGVRPHGRPPKVTKPSRVPTSVLLASINTDPADRRLEELAETGAAK
jgi:hypothetical protein